MAGTGSKPGAPAAHENDPPGEGWNRCTLLEERFGRAETVLSRGRRGLVQKIIEDSDETYFLSSRELAKRYGVDVGTIVRTVQALGYTRYADFIADLRAHFVVRMNPYTVMKAATRKSRQSLSQHVRNTIELGAHNLNAMRSELDLKRVVELAKRIGRSRKIVVVGADLASSLSYFFSYWLVALGFDSVAPVGSIGVLNQTVDLLGRRDLLIAISFGRCLRATVEAAIRARKRHAVTFGITDSNRSPIARFCDSSLITPKASSRTELGVSYVGPMSAIEAALSACAYLDPKRSLFALKRKDEEQAQSDSRWYPSGDGDRKLRARRSIARDASSRTKEAGAPDSR